MVACTGRPEVRELSPSCRRVGPDIYSVHARSCLDVDCDGFLGGGDLQHWYCASEAFVDTQVGPPVPTQAICEP